MIKTFDTFQPSIETFTGKIGILDENHDMPELFSDKSADVVIKITENAFSTYQVFNRLPGSKFIPKYVSNRLHVKSIGAPITVISPLSEIRTFSSYRELNSSPIRKGSIYFKRPNFTDQVQVVMYEGRIIGARQLIDGKAVHLNLNRLPILDKIKMVAEGVHNALHTDLTRFRIGLTKGSPVLLAMENFKLKKPELAQLYYNIYENFVGHMPEWFKHHIESTMIMPYLYEYIDREEVSKKCPYLL